MVIDLTGEDDPPVTASIYIDLTLEEDTPPPTPRSQPTATAPWGQSIAAATIGAHVIDLSRLTTDGRRQMCGAIPLDKPCPKSCNCACRYNQPFSDMEKAIFLDKFVQFPKNFSKIASFLKNQCTKSCIKFYYESKMREDHGKSLGVHGNTNSVEALTDSLFEVEQNRPGDENAVNGASSVGRSTGMELEIDFDIASIAWRLNKKPGLLPGTLAYRTDAEVKALGFFAKYYELPLTGREPTRKEGARTVFYEARPMCFDAIFLSSSQSQSVELLTWLTEEGLCTSDDLKRKWGQREETLINTMAKMRKLKIVKWLVSRIGDASFGETNNDGKCPIFRLTLGTNRYNIDFEVIKFIVLNSKPSSEYVDGVSSSDGRSDLRDWASNFRVCFEMMYIPALRILRRWAVLCLEQKITGQGSVNRKKMLGCVVQMSQSVEARRKERGGDLAPDEEDTEADFTAVSSENDAEEEEDEYSATRLREEREGREEETDPLLKVFLPPMGHIWVYKKGHYDCM